VEGKPVVLKSIAEPSPELAQFAQFIQTLDLSLNTDDALNGFLKRWSCEVANWYIAERLGWANCRLWRVEAAEKFLMVL
jgi:hypothetical protein